MTLRDLEPAAAITRLRQFEGIGPFYAELVTVRTLGHTDVLPSGEPKVVAATAMLLDRPQLDQREFEAVAEAWRPWRTWAAVSIRAGSMAT